METRKFEKNPIALKMIPFFLVSAGIIVLGVLAIFFIKPYGIWIFIGLFVLSMFVDILGMIFALRLTTVNCPECERTLKRKSRQEAEYACEVCGINWVLTKNTDT